ncbi:hypothetical protein QWY99_12970 [Flavobacterium branchiarum]|uniref:hypothetical protein n=1 Tax=Flavobacterium branchiarum TaxID=1114870 RepID=UPI0025B43C7A|nr:hypothetical protein [Flavobacterium branchiarum]MDN3673965.1 hypothetical protein [Flavobacterium branchiarum]
MDYKKEATYKNMRNYIFKFWLLNLVSTAILFLVYYILAFTLLKSSDGNLFKIILEFLFTLFNLYYTLVYSIVMIIFSTAFFLNLKETIRTNFFLSLLTFIGIPLVALIYILIDLYPYDSFAVVWWIGFPFVYLLFIIVQFYIFRKSISKYECS